MFQMTFASLEVNRQAEWVNTQIVSADDFDVLGVRPRLGRTFLPDEDKKPGGDNVLVISERLWRRRFAADPGIVGRVVELNRHPFTIVGVLPKPFRGAMSALAFDVWAPSSMIWEVWNQRLEGRSARGWHNLARLQPDVSLARARAAVEARNAQLAQAYPDTNRGSRHRVVPLPECPYGAQAVMGPVLRLLQAVSLGVLLIVAVNVANLSLALASGRRKEIAIQLSLGASRKGSGVSVEGYLPRAGEDTTYEFAIVSPRYLATMRIPLVVGREFTEADDAGSVRVAIVNEAFDARFWPGKDALGRRFRTRGEWRRGCCSSSGWSHSLSPRSACTG
jgi:hypothetical protein